ncbi:MAG: hypothetical protein ACD_73C00046G0003 [uncultured bacterium]|nr:MAG: hypothetical protein ACD_73C00046G0003 [uncultured bacterium]
MNQAIFIPLNILLIIGALFLFRQKGILSYVKGGKWWLTWLAVGVITLMDEMTSIFYAPSEAYRFIGTSALVFIPFTAVFIYFLTTRLVEIGEILDVHKLKGGGVYNFSYLVLGPVISFVAVASILVDYVLTAAISTVSAIENASFFFHLGADTKLFIEVGVIWLVALLNISGIRNNAKVTFGIFLFTAVVFLNLIIAGLLHVDARQISSIGTHFIDSFHHVKDAGAFLGYFVIVVGISSCILAYSGVESVLQTANFVEDWKVIKKSYLFRALSVGLMTPILSVLVLSHPKINFEDHATDLIVHYAFSNFGNVLGVLIAVVASVTLVMAVNTAFIATSELLERVAHRYNFHWLIKTNRLDSLYRIHVLSALFFSLIVVLTQGGQETLAHMYAIGLIATFTIHMAALLIYRYSKGTKEVLHYHVSRTGTLVLFILIVSCFAYLSYQRPHGFFLWIGTVAVLLVVGIFGTKKRSPELAQVQKGESPMDIILYIAEDAEPNVHLYFKRPFDRPQEKMYAKSVFVTFYSPRQPIPERIGDNHFRIPAKRASIYYNTLAILELLDYEFADRNLSVFFGWPTSSWFDRLSIGVMIFQIMRFPKIYPKMNFRIESFRTQ